MVVSAFSRVTDLLVRGANLALARDSDYENVIFEILERHHGAINELVPRGPAQDRLLAHLDATITELRALYTGVYHLAELTARPWTRSPASASGSPTRSWPRDWMRRASPPRASTRAA